jgi:hypothetical protein
MIDNLTPRILLLGPPAVGKTTLVALLQEMYGFMTSYDHIEGEVQRLALTHGIAEPLPDFLINEAAAVLLARIPRRGPCLIELPHHDYVSLIEAGALDVTSFDAVAVLTAEAEELVERNARRREQVPLPYLIRCVGAVTAIVEYLRIKKYANWLRINSSVLSPRQQVQLLVDFLRRKESSSLARIAVAPHPERPDLGGHLIDDSEWDEVLVRWLIERFGIRTALDVGCGAAFTIERFERLGVMAWGIDGNSAVLTGPARRRERLLVVDFAHQWVHWPVQPDLVWCVEVLEHIAPGQVHHVVQTICNNTGKVAFVSAAAPGQPGYHHVNCQTRDTWIEQLEQCGLKLSQEGERVLASLDDQGPFGRNDLRRNGMVLVRGQ